MFHSSRRLVAVLVFALTVALAGPSLLGQTHAFVAFGPRIYVRQAGEPTVVHDSFAVRNPSAPYSIRIRTDRGAMGTVALNGLVIANRSDLRLSDFTKTITVQSTNELVVEREGAPGSTITVEIVGIDNDLPTITAMATPAANANGWNNTNVTIAFSCADATSGVASCPAAQSVSSDGTTLVSGTVVDNAANTATTQISVNLDKTAPSVALGAPTGAGPVSVAGTASDAGSGIVSVTCNGTPTPVNSGAFTCAGPFSNGANTLIAVATDRAGNSASSTISFTIAPPLAGSFSITPTLGTAGTLFRCRANGFTVSGPLTLHVKQPNGSELPTRTLTVFSGFVSCSLDSLDLAPGTYEAWLVDNTTGASTAHAGFDVVAAPTSGGGPLGASVHGLAIAPWNPQVVYAGTRQGSIFKSTDGGNSWQLLRANLFNPMADVGVSLIAAPGSGDVIYAAGARGIFKSGDGGHVWTPSNTGLGGVNSVYGLAIDPTNPAVLYSLPNGRVFKTTNGGANWFSASAGLPGENMKTLAVHPTNSSIVYAGGDHGSLFKSLDGGATWIEKPFPIPTPVFDIAIDPASAATLYVAVGVGVFKSSDGGDSWSVISPASNMTFSVRLDPNNPSVVFAAVPWFGIFKSMNGGGSWTNITNGLPLEPDQGPVAWSLSIASSNPAAVFLASDDGLGIFKSADQGATWHRSKEGLTGASVSASAAAADGVLFAGLSDRESLFRSADEGQTWTRIFFGNGTAMGLPVLSTATAANSSTVYVGTVSGIARTSNGGATWAVSGPPGPGSSAVNGASVIRIDPHAPANVFISVPFFDGGLFKSDNGGATWRQTYSGDCRSVDVNPANGLILFAACTSRILKSTDGGETWSQSRATSFVTGIAIDPADPAVVYAGESTSGSIYKSSDAGQTWSKLAVSGVNTIVIAGTSPSSVFGFCASCSPVAGQASLVRSTDGGATWMAADGGLPAGGVVGTLSVDRRDPLVLYVGTRGLGTFRSVDGGRSWTPLGK